MERRRFGLAVLMPLLAVICVAAYAGSLGALFTLLNEELPHVAEVPIGVVIPGIAIVIGVPAIAAILERQTEKKH